MDKSNPSPRELIPLLSQMRQAAIAMINTFSDAKIPMSEIAAVSTNLTSFSVPAAETLLAKASPSSCYGQTGG